MNIQIELVDERGNHINPSHISTAGATSSDLAKTTRRSDIGLVTQWRTSGVEPLATERVVHRFSCRSAPL